MRFLLFSFFTFLTMIGSMAQATPASTNSPSNSNTKQVIILMGPPGSGKGTQATRITQQLKIPHISTGDLFRENINQNTDVGQRAKVFMNAGKLVPDEIVLEMLKNRVALPDCAKGYLLDGFPRTIPQAEALDKLMDPHTKIIAISLEVSDDAILKRMSGRLICKNCGSIFNRYFAAPSKEGTCDQCQGPLYQRDDDKEEVVKERLRVYQAQTAPLIDFYKKKGVLHPIQGEQNPDLIFQQIMKIVSP